MKSFRKFRVLIVLANLALAGLLSLPAGSQPAYGFAEEAGYGSLTGQYVFDGAIPKPVMLVTQGDPTVKDGGICAAANLASDALTIDPKSKGIANIFVYLAKAKTIHPKLKESAAKEVVFDQKGCRFIPHTLLVRTDQTVLVKSADPIAHNTHTNPLRGQAFNGIVPPNDRKGVPVTAKISENLPTKVVCDIHPWMNAYWLVLDHPYAAVTDADGKFTIADLPAGEYEFRVWHELPGYIERKLKVTIKAGETTDIGKVAVSAAKF